MIKRVLYSLFILASSLILSTTLLRNVAIWGVMPDIGMILLIFFASTNGSLEAQYSGFAFGMMEDFISLSPLGFHAFIRTLTGHLFGLGRGNIFYDPILIPTLMVLLGTLLKYSLTWSLSLVFQLGLGFSDVFNTGFLIEVLYNAVLASLLYLLYTNFINKDSVQRGAFHV